MQYDTNTACCHAMSCALQSGQVKMRAATSASGGSTYMLEPRFVLAETDMVISYCPWCGVGLNTQAVQSLQQRGLRR